MSSVQNPEYVNSILQGLAIPFFIVDNDFKIVFFNSNLEKLTGFKMAEAIGKPCHEIFQSNICNDQCALRETMTKGRDIVNMEISIRNRKKDSIQKES